MGTQEFIEMLNNVCNDLFPIVLVVLMIYAIRVFSSVINTMKKINTTIDTTTKMLENCDKQISKLDAPLSTVNELSQTVDQVHEVTKNALTSSLVMLINNFSAIKDHLLKKMNTEEETIIVDEDELEV